MSFSERLKIERENAGLSQTELATLIGIAPNTLSTYETTNREPRLSLVVKIAKALKISLDELVNKDDSNNNIEEYNRYLPVGFSIKFDDKSNTFILSSPQFSANFNNDELETKILPILKRGVSEGERMKSLTIRQGIQELLVKKISSDLALRSPIPDSELPF